MKKLISLLLCALMVASLPLTAFAVPAPVGGVGEGLSPCAVNGDCGNHSWVLYDASCDGYWQTWYYRCDNSDSNDNNCNAHTTSRYRCIGKDHNGGCLWLPI